MEKVREGGAAEGSGGGEGAMSTRMVGCGMLVAVAPVMENGESSSSCSNLDRMIVAETASAVDSQATEVIIS